MNAFALRPVVPAAVSAAPGSVSGFAVENILNDFMGVVFKCTAGSTFLDVDLGASPPPVDQVLFFGCTGATGGSITVTVSNTGFGASPFFSSGSTDFLAGATMPTHGRGVGWWENPTPITGRYWRFQLTGIAAANLIIGRMVMGQRLTLARNFEFGGAWGVRDLGRLDFSAAGVMLRRQAARLRTLGLSFPNVHKDEIEGKVQPLLELRASQHPIALVTDPAAHANRQLRCWFGPLQGDLGTIWRAAHAWVWRANLIDLVPIPRDVI